MRNLYTYYQYTATRYLTAPQSLLPSPQRHTSAPDICLDIGQGGRASQPFLLCGIRQNPAPPSPSSGSMGPAQGFLLPTPGCALHACHRHSPHVSLGCTHTGTGVLHSHRCVVTVPSSQGNNSNTISLVSTQCTKTPLSTITMSLFILHYGKLPLCFNIKSDNNKNNHKIVITMTMITIN